MRLRHKRSVVRAEGKCPLGSVWATFAMVISCLSIGIGATRADELDIVELQRRVKERVKIFSTIDLAWKATSHFTRADSARLASSPFGDETSQTNERFPATFEWQAHLWCDGDKMRLEHARPVWMFDNSRFETPNTLLVFDGDEAKFLSTYIDNSFAHQGIVRNDPIYVIGDADFSQFVWHFRAFTYPGMLAEFFSADVEVSQEELEGRDCSVVRQHKRRSNGSTYEQALWLDIEADCVVRRNAALVNGRVTYDHRISHYRNDDGHMVPERWNFESYDPNGRLLRSMSAKVIQAIINQPIAASVFQLEFPEGTSVSDQRGEGERRLLIGTGEREFEVTSAQTAAATSPMELLESLERAEDGHGKIISGILAASAAGLVAAALIFILRRRRKFKLD